MHEPHTTSAPDPVTDRQRWTALDVLWAGVLMIVLDATIVHVALPSIQDDLGFSQTGRPRPRPPTRTRAERPGAAPLDARRGVSRR